MPDIFAIKSSLAETGELFSLLYYENLFHTLFFFIFLEFRVIGPYEM